MSDGLPEFMRVFGLSIASADEHGAVLDINVPDSLMSPFGAVHGGVIAAAFDTGLAVAIARRLEPTDRIATHNLNVSFVSFAREQRLRCRSRVVSLRTGVGTAEGEIETEAGVLIAKALGTFGIRRKPRDGSGHAR